MKNRTNSLTPAPCPEATKCPFCAGTHMLIDTITYTDEEYGDSIQYAVWCGSCGTSTCETENKSTAIRNWNMRLEDESVIRKMLEWEASIENKDVIENYDKLKEILAPYREKK